VAFGLDALGRHASQSVGTVNPTSTTYAYLGTSDQISSTSSGATLTTSSIDAIGDRLTSGTTAGYAAIVCDLHGNVAATIVGTSFSAAYRYDAFGETLDTYTGTGAIGSLWRYQGRILESSPLTTGGTDLYDFGARSYDPSLGIFTSFDSVSGSAQNPRTLNRYLYANANPATLVDPDGHYASYCVSLACVQATGGVNSSAGDDKVTTKASIKSSKWDKAQGCAGIACVVAAIVGPTATPAPVVRGGRVAVSGDPLKKWLDECTANNARDCKAGGAAIWHFVYGEQPTGKDNQVVSRVKNLGHFRARIGWVRSGR
jgi:RHS repeat-associated protein